MVDEGGMEDDLGGHRGSITPDAMWQALQDFHKEFWALLDAIDPLDPFIEACDKICEDFTCDAIKKDSRDEISM